MGQRYLLGVSAQADRSEASWGDARSGSAKRTRAAALGRRPAATATAARHCGSGESSGTNRARVFVSTKLCGTSAMPRPAATKSGRECTLLTSRATRRSILAPAKDRSVRSRVIQPAWKSTNVSSFSSSRRTPIRATNSCAGPQASTIGSLVREVREMPGFARWFGDDRDIHVAGTNQPEQLRVPPCRSRTSTPWCA